MLKNLIIAILSALAGAAVVTIKKDRVILELKKEVTLLSSYEHFTKIHRMGYASGYSRGALDEKLDQVRRNADQN